jgi:hypothetical protein
MKFVKVKTPKHNLGFGVTLSNICVHCYLTFTIPHGDRSDICDHPQTKEHKADIYAAFSSTKFISFLTVLWVPITVAARSKA